MPSVPDASVAETPQRVSVAWPSTVEGRYRVAWKAEQRVSLEHVDTGGGVVTSSVEFNGTLGLREATVAGRRLLRVRFIEVERGVLRMEDGKQRGDVDLGTLRGTAFHVEVMPDGKHAALVVPSGHPALLQQALVLLASHLGVVTPVGPVTGKDTWAGTHATASGEVVLAYALAQRAPVTLSRTLERTSGTVGNTTGSFSGTVQLDSAGVPVRVEDKVTLGGGGTFRGALTETFLLEKLGDEAGSPPVEEAPTAQVRRLGSGESAITTSRSTELKQRIGSMTRETMVRDLRLIGADGKPPAADPHMWRWQASGLLQADASAVRALESVFHEPTVTDDARNQVLDLLQSAGDANCQEVLIRILSRPDVQQHKRFAAWVQRVSLVNEPTEATRAWAERSWVERKDKPLAVGAPFAVMFGAVVGHSLADAAARAFVDRGITLLLDALAGARDATTRDAYLQAVGNIHDARVLAPMLAHAADPDPRVRSIVARNLVAHPRNNDAMNALHGFTTDVHPQVALDALGTLVHVPMTPAHRARLRTDVVAGRVHPRAFGGVMNVVDSWAGDAEDVAILQHIRAHAKDPRTAGRAGTLLDRRQHAAGTAR